ncbi:hypothetical protein BDV97DRAFT_398535 [Delphinella strobiligena]|nr:hypothetical protein BDV97DRAFT_398535 [Delphinella strobiligena]
MAVNVANSGNAVEAPEQRNPREVVLIRRLFSNVNNMIELANLTNMLVRTGYSEEECFQIYKLGSIDDGENTEVSSHRTVVPSPHTVIPSHRAAIASHHTVTPSQHTVIPRQQCAPFDG